QAASGCVVVSTVSNTTSFPVTPPVTSVVVSKQQTTAGGSGAAITYRVIVTNNGTATVTNVTVTDTVSTVVTGQATAQPGVFAPPTAVAVAGGFRYVWTAGGLVPL